MASAPHAQQLWLDVAQGVQPRPSGTMRQRSPRPSPNEQPVSEQLELRMTPRPTPAIHQEQPRPIVAAPPVATPPASGPPCFATWLKDQIKRPGLIGDLAKAARDDRLFPKKGSADDVRARFSAAGADGDAFEALDYAERDYDRRMMEA